MHKVNPVRGNTQEPRVVVSHQKQHIPSSDMLQKFKRTVGWKRSKRKKGSPPASDFHHTGTQSPPSSESHQDTPASLSANSKSQGSGGRQADSSASHSNQPQPPTSDASIDSRHVPSLTDVLQNKGNDALLISGSSGPATNIATEHPSSTKEPAPAVPRIDTSLRKANALSPPSMIPVVHAPQGILEGAKDFKIENSILTNVQGNAVVFRFDTGSPPSEEFKSVLMNHMAGSITVRDLDKIERRTLSQAIRDLPRAKAAYDDYVTRDRRRTACFEGTRHALLEEIAQCVTGSEGPRAYLLFGIAGVGKSTVAQTVAERTDNLRLLGASFFFSRDEVDRRNAERFFTTIAFQLCVYDADFAQAIGTALTEERGAAATSKDPLRQLKSLILEPLQAIAMSRSLPTVIVVDALDECDADDGPVILMALDQLVRNLPFFKVILTTRPQVHLQYLLNHLGSHQVFRMEDIEGKVVEGDIRLYLEHSLSQDEVGNRLPSLRRKWAASEEEVSSLVGAAGLLFIIASTAVLFILDPAARNPASRMKTLREEFAQNRTSLNALNNFYTVILRNAVPLGCEHDIVDRYQAVVGTIVLIEDPLPVCALANLVGTPEDDVHAVLENLQSVISLGENDIPLVYHKSFPDYITDDQRCQAADLHISPRHHHTRLATSCLYMMNSHLKRNILSLGAISRYLDNDKALEEERLSRDNVQQVIPSELQYASVHWASHLVQANLEDCNLVTELKVFTQEHLLHWLEASSWIYRLNLAPISLSAVLKLPTLNSEMREIFNDTLRFVSRDFDKIGQNALYIYHSSLPLVPTETLLRRTYKHQVLLCQVEGGPKQWNMLISEKNHGFNVSRIAFAKDNSQFASWNSHTNSVKLWDSASGTPIRAFDGNLIALADDFSVLAVAQSNSVTMYSVPSRAPITAFNHASAVVKMAISFDGSWLAAGLESGTVDIWDVTKGVPIASLDDYNGHFVVFSSRGRILAFTSKAGISLCSGANIVARLDHEPDEAVRIVFSLDGTRLATVAAYTLRLWNGQDGRFISVVTNVGEQLAISADSSLVATGGVKRGLQLWAGDSLTLVDTVPTAMIWGLAFSGDMLAITSQHEITLYDIRSKTVTATLSIHKPSSFSFSPDGTRLAAGNYSGAVCLWDVSSINPSTSTHKELSSPVWALSFSPDCSRLASGYQDGSFKLWKTSDMRKAIADHRCHSGCITALAFSLDSDQLASGSLDKSVKLWDGRDGSPSGILEHSLLHELTSLAFSDTLLAAATRNVVTLWDRTSRRSIHTFKQGSESLSFSLDGSVLVSTESVLYNFTFVTVWDTKTLTVASTFTIDGITTRLLPSPDSSRFAAQSRDSGFTFFDIIKKEIISNVNNTELSWVPGLDGVPTSWGFNHSDGYRLIGRLSSSHDSVPVLWVPPGLHVRGAVCASQSSMFALGCTDNGILLIQRTASYR